MDSFSTIIKDWHESDNRTVIENLNYMEDIINTETNNNINLEKFLPDFTNVIYDNDIILNNYKYQLETYCNIL